MTGGRKLTRGVAIYGAGEVAIQAINFLLLPIYVLYLSPGDYGILALLAGIEAPVKLFFRWGIDGAFMRYWYDCQDARDRQRLASTLFLFLLAVNGVLLLLAVAFAGALSQFIFRTPDYALALQLVLLNTFAIGFTFIPFHVLRMQDRAAEYSLLTVSRSALTVIARLALVVWFERGVLGVVIADVLVTGIILVALLRWFAPLIRVAFSWDTLRLALSFGLPRVPHGLALQVMAVADRFILERFRSVSEVGMYSIGVSFGLIPKIALGAFEAAWAPFYYATSRAPGAQQTFSRITTVVIALLAIATAGLAAIARDLLMLMTGGRFVEAAPVVGWTALGVFFYGGYLLTSIGLNITSHTRYYPVSTLIGAVVTVGLNLALVPGYGLLGAAWATAAGYFVQMVLAYRFSQRFYPITYDWRRIGGCVAAAALALAAAALVPAMPAVAGIVVRGSVVLAVAGAGLLLTGVLDREDLQILTAIGRRRRQDAAKTGTVEVTELAGEVVAVDVSEQVSRGEQERRS